MERVFDLNCSFCNEINHKASNNFYEIYLKDYFTKKNKKDRILCENDNFIIMPMVGPLVKEYLLLVPKGHYLSFSHMDESLLLEAESLIDKTRNIFFERYGLPSIVFEHGAMSHKFKGGCCSDHAHIHIVGTQADAYDGICQSGYLPQKIMDITQLRMQKERNMAYLFYMTQDNNKYVFDAPIVEGQFIRKVIAKKIGATERAYWNNNIRLDWMVEIIDDLKNEFSIMKI